MQLFRLELAAWREEGSVVIAFVGDWVTFSALDDVLLFDGWWREGDPVYKDKAEQL